MRYSTHLLQLEGENGKKFKNNVSKCKSMSVANQIVSGIALTSGTAGIVSAISIVGLPVTLGLSVVSAVNGLASGIFTTLARGSQKNAIRYQQKVGFLSQVRIRLNEIIASTYSGTLLSDEKISAAMEIYSEAFKKVHQLRIDGVKSINLDIEAGLELYTDGLENIKKELGGSQQ